VKLFDVNVLIYAHREDTPEHERVRSWWEAELNRPDAFGMVELVLSSFVRIVTNPKVFKTPSSLDETLQAVERIRRLPNCVPIRPGERHFELFTNICSEGHAKGALVADAYLAALAIENGCQWMTFDRDFARFPGLDWAVPLEDDA